MEERCTLLVDQQPIVENELNAFVIWWNDDLNYLLFEGLPLLLLKIGLYHNMGDREIVILLRLDLVAENLSLVRELLRL